MLKKNHINCVVRKEFGHDIEAACGQLRSSQMKRDRAEKQKHNEIELPHLRIEVWFLCAKIKQKSIFL